MSDDIRQKIKDGLAPLFAEARAKGLWFHCAYQDMWFSPDGLEKEQAAGRLLWGAVNWQLRDPKERLQEAERQALAANENVERIRREIEP